MIHDFDNRINVIMHATLWAAGYLRFVYMSALCHVTMFVDSSHALFRYLSLRNFYAFIAGASGRSKDTFTNGSFNEQSTRGNSVLCVIVIMVTQNTKNHLLVPYLRETSTAFHNDIVHFIQYSTVTRIIVWYKVACAKGIVQQYH